MFYIINFTNMTYTDLSGHMTFDTEIDNFIG